MGDVAAVTLALPRMEWPFLSQWCELLSKRGVTRLYLGEHEDLPDIVWPRKPNPKYYHLDLSTSELADRWEHAVQVAQGYLTVIRVPVPRRSLHTVEEQVPFFQAMGRRAEQDGYGWVLQCDIDELPVLAVHGDLVSLTRAVTDADPNVGGIIGAQYVFESRWDASRDYAPRDYCQIKRYHPSLLHVLKLLYRPGRVTVLGPHAIIPACPSADVHGLSPEVLVFHHLRGVEPASHALLSHIQRFPLLADNPFDPLPRYPADRESIFGRHHFFGEARPPSET